MEVDSAVEFCELFSTFEQEDPIYPIIDKGIRENKRKEKLIEKGLYYPLVYVTLSEEELITTFPEYPSSDQPCHCKKFKNTGNCECNYKHSFPVDQHEQIKKYLDYYGVCVVRLLDEETCEKTIQAFFEDVNGKSKFQKRTNWVE